MSTLRASRHMVASADHLASRAGDLAFARGGNAVDAAIATNAAMAVVAPHLCGLGGDLFALVHTGRSVAALNASGRAPSGADAGPLRTSGATEMPFRHDIRSVTMPGCADGWIALHSRFGSLPLSDVLEPAIDLAVRGFPASPLLVRSARMLDEAGARNLAEIVEQATAPGRLVRRPGVGRALRAIAERGRDGFYGGEFGEGLLQLGRGWFQPADLAESSATWVEPLTVQAFGVDLHTIGPNSQGYLLLGGALVAEHHGLADDPDDVAWAHALIEAAKVAGFDRPDVLHDGADGAALVAAIRDRAGLAGRVTASTLPLRSQAGDTTYLCTAEVGGMAVSLIQSNASGFGSWLVESNTSINLHNRGIGFSVEAGHPAELMAHRRPPHTLSPALASDASGVRAVFGTMGGDAQPQVLLQIAARLFRHGQSPGTAIDAARWVLRGPVTGFDTWTADSPPAVMVEAHAPAAWIDELRGRGHDVVGVARHDPGFGHAHAIVTTPDGLAGAADPRTVVGSVAAR